MSDTNQQRQSQVQSQTQSIQISIDSAGDPELERRIFRDVHSVGRQLARLSDALAVVLERVDLQGGTPDPQALKAIAEFKKMRDEIRQELDNRDRNLIGELQELRDKHRERFDALTPDLRALLESQAGTTTQG